MNPSTSRPVHPPQPRPVIQGTVLVVEDNPAMNEAISEILRMEGYRVISAVNGVEALAILEQERPDVVVSDIMMPGIDGYELLRRARQDPRLRTLPFIFLTARSSTEDYRLAKRIGIEDYLVKPVDSRDLSLAVANALRRSRHVQEEMQEQMDALRNQILSTLQHEFRTPLTFILGYAEYLADSSQGGEPVDVDTLREAVQAILEGGHRLQNLVEKFLLIADLQQRMDLADVSELFDPWTVIQEVAQQMTPQAEEVSLQLALHEPTIRVQVLGVADLVGQALSRLLENALEYRRPDSRQVEIFQNLRDGFVGLAVRDEGPGIPASVIGRLTAPFEQVEREDRIHPGAGLGLAIVRHIARLHGGELEIESQEGQGSTFTLWLPYLKQGTP